MLQDDILEGNTSEDMFRYWLLLTFFIFHFIHSFLLLNRSYSNFYF